MIIIIFIILEIIITNKKDMSHLKLTSNANPRQLSKHLPLRYSFALAIFLCVVKAREREEIDQHISVRQLMLDLHPHFGWGEKI